MTCPSYAELHCLTHFTFLRGASRPEELVQRAHALGYRALAVTDECSVAGIVRAHVAAKTAGIPLIVGTEIVLHDGPKLVLLCPDRAAYGQMSRLLTRGRRATEKGTYRLTRADVAELSAGCLALWVPEMRTPRCSQASERQHLEWMREVFAGRGWVAAELLRDGHDRPRLERLARLSAQFGLPLVASGDVHMHVRERRHLQDAVTSIRHGVTLATAGRLLHPNGERHLRERERLARLYPRELLDETLVVAERCAFSLDELRYEYPRELVPEGETPTSYLRLLTHRGLAKRWPAGAPPKVRETVDAELALIRDLAYEPFFLTVNDVVTFAQSQGILCQGRGSAANSVVCYSLGITEVSPDIGHLVMERFISRERNEPPDIDVDFEHERREEVIQYIYAKYGRERAALAATVITYRPRSALRDLGKVLGLEPEALDRLASTMQWWDNADVLAERIREAGFDPADPRISRLLHLAQELMGFPRHLSQHVGGFVIAEGALDALVPIENASMPDRTVIQWDKDDIEDLGLIKVDVLGLGMLTAIRRALALVSRRRGAPFAMADVPKEDSTVYDMICEGDTVGVFQIESRAQMSMLPRLRPRKYYDLVIQVAIVRPGPIQGDMVHPYLRRRTKQEQVTYPNDEVRGVLERTLGVPLFQEQVMQLAVVAAGFTPGEADALRRSMAAWKRRGGLDHFEQKLISGMRARNYDEQFARQVFNQILGFGSYGFPESHAASFALLVYVSSWLKRHEPAAFTCALLNSLPMGFYAPAQLVRDVRRHGVEVRPVDVRTSDAESSLEEIGPLSQPALRLGLERVKGLSLDAAARVMEARRVRAFESVQDLTVRAELDRRDLEALAAAGALAGLAGHRYHAFWEVAGSERSLPLAPTALNADAVPMLAAPTEGEDIVADYHAIGLTLGRHPVALLRKRLTAERAVSAADIDSTPAGATIKFAGIVITRQRPSSASGVTFVTLEDETGHVNLVVWEQVGERFRRALLHSKLMEVRGTLQREAGVTHVIARSLIDRSPWLGDLVPRSRDFH